MNEKATALVIDDEPQIRRLLRILLEQEQYRALESDSGRHGLSEIALRRPDVVLLDLGLPDMDGMAVLERLRQWSRVPVLVLSVRDGAEDKVVALDAGADDFVTKPFDLSQMPLNQLQLLKASVRSRPTRDWRLSSIVPFSPRSILK